MNQLSLNKMKIKPHLLTVTLLILISSSFVHAQKSQGIVTGRIIDSETGAPLEFATITLYSAADSALVNGASTDPEGNFTVEVPLGPYFARFRFLSYGESYENNIRLNAANPQVNLGTLELTPDTETLAEVEVVGEKDQVQLALDKKIFNVGESLARVGGSASEILDNIPSVTVDVDGNVSLRGSDNVQIFIDGKPSGLVGISSTEALRSLPADMIERVEVITNPSARYQAEGVAGIINIVLKKERRDGVNLGVSANTGYPHNHGASVNLNYRKNWYNLFMNYGIRYNDFTGTGSETTQFFNPNSDNGIYFTESANERNRRGLSNSIRFGSDFFLDEKNTITASYLYRKSDGENTTNVTYRDFDINRSPLSNTLRHAVEEEDEPTSEVNLSYRRTFDKQGQLLTADLQYRNSTELEIERITETRSTEGNSIQQRTSNEESDQSYLLQIDYANPIGENAIWEAGIRSTSRQLGNDYQVFSQQANQWQMTDSLSNNFIYYEDVHAAYAIFGDKPGRFSYQLGLRAEYSDINSDLHSINRESGLMEITQSNPRKYLSLFPTTHFTYQLSDNRSVEWSYSRRIRRPGQRWLNPFLSLTDNRSYRTGNPNLNPEFTNSVELGYLHHFSKASLNSSIYYRNTQDVIQRVTTSVPTDSVTLRYTMPMNLASENSYGFEFVLTADITTWWKTNTNFNFYRQVINGENVEGTQNTTLNSDTYTWNARTNSQFKLAPGLNAQLTFFYRAPNERPQGRNKSLAIADFGINKEILDKKGTLSFTVNDIFNTRRWRSETYNDDFYSEGDFQWRPRTFNLGFTYQLRKTNKKEGQKRGSEQNGGGDDMDF